MLRFLETLTGVAIPNLSAWRRSTFGDLTSAFGFPVNAPFPRLPGTKAQLAQAVQQVNTLPAPRIPTTTRRRPPRRPGRGPARAALARVTAPDPARSRGEPDVTSSHS